MSIKVGARYVGPSSPSSSGEIGKVYKLNVPIRHPNPFHLRELDYEGEFIVQLHEDQYLLPLGASLAEWTMRAWACPRALLSVDEFCEISTDNPECWESQARLRRDAVLAHIFS